MTKVEEVQQLLTACTEEQRREVFQLLRREFSIHPLEDRLNTEAELVLEAIHRSGGLIFRMIRGVIAEAAFAGLVLPSLQGWHDATPPGDLPFDYVLADEVAVARVQVKLQRSKHERPMRANEGYRKLSPTMFVAETQKTRGGTKGGEQTRPYRFGEFDILAVAMYPSLGRWDAFMYTVADWLLPDTWLKPKSGNPTYLLKFQPIPMEPNDDWTDDFEECVRWLRSGVKKQISAG